MNDSFYKPVSNKPNFNSIEKEIIEFWKENNIFQKSIESRENAKEFTFYEGPPTANGKPGVHHVLARTFKDLLCRYQTMKGKKVIRNAGWDEHGLPVEIEVQKQNNLKSKEDIEKMGIAKFNELCSQSTQKYINEWEDLTDRMAYWVDFKQAYRTSNPQYIERVWSIIKKLFDSNLLYRGHKVVPWACDSGTVVSQAEVALGYKDVIDESAYVKFQLSEESSKRLFNKIQNNTGKVLPEGPVFLLAWTTTPWTLPSNMALAVNPNIKYRICKKKDSSSKDNEYVILSDKRWKILLGEEEWERVTSYQFEAEDNFCYESLFEQRDKNSFLGIKLNKSFVEDDESIGTAIVHIAPAFGQDDFNLYSEEKQKSEVSEIVCLVDQAGTFTNEAPEFLKGQSIFNENRKTGNLEFARINKIICKHLQEKGLLLKTEKYEHSYPHNWRTGNPLIYFLRPSWYVRTQDLRVKLLEANNKVSWHPNHVKEGRFGKWLENNVDWSISRERYWGTPLPLWIGETSQKVVAVGSLKELENFSGLKLDDPHKPMVDEITWEENGEKFKRVPEVLDCWFDSGSMPYASEENPRGTADYICEAVDQTRGWFYSLLAITVSLMDSFGKEPNPPYKNVLCLGHILDKDGQKMSKSKGNVINPWELFEQFGADPVRWYMISACSAGQPIRFDLAGINEVMRRFILPLWNTYAFYVLYANLDGITDDILNTPGELLERQLQPIDLWIVARLSELNRQVTDEYENYEFAKASQLIEKFVDDLSNVWVRANRSRFWNTSSASLSNIDLAAYNTLHTCLLGVCRLSAPFIPLLSETIYQNLKPTLSEESIHLTYWPEPELNTDLENKLIGEMNTALEIVNIGRSQRQELKIKIRQPLAKIFISKDVKVTYFKDFILNELNIKDIEFTEQKERVKLDTELSIELISEGLARELIHSIQNLRKNSGLSVSDRINLFFDFKSEVELNELLLKQKTYITEELLAISWNEGQLKNSSTFIKTIKLNGKQIEVAIEKVN
ncbi:MAG: isoleucine--tRNA ligase [Candidatus Caenarcaniphilales bacterium]|nr:isoleucine--tRNA ligase [Candidatus Caenarcaniphilales bacterium]